MAFFFLISGWWGKVKLIVGGTIPILCVSGFIIKHEKWAISMKPVSSTLPWAPSQLPLLGSCPIRVPVLTLFSYITWCTSKRKISIFLLKLFLVLVFYHGNSNQKRGINTFYSTYCIVQSSCLSHRESFLGSLIIRVPFLRFSVDCKNSHPFFVIFVS